MSHATRREFLGTAAASTAAAVNAADSDRVVVGVIGCGGMGNQHIRRLSARKDVEIAWVCDADDNRSAASAKSIEQVTGKAPATCRDMRKVLDDKRVAAVWMATPDHWHAPGAILAVDAGKHVYVEKPCSHNIREGRLMIEAARRNKRVMQVGTQTRSSAHAIEAMKLLHSGIIGDVPAVRVWNSQLRRSIGKQKPSAPPAHLDYDAWLGPAPYVPYQSNLLHGSWRWWYAFGTGDMGNDGVHDLDIGRWGLGVSEHPSTITALGGKYFFDDDQQFPDTQTVVMEYPDVGGRKKQLIFEQRIWSPYVQEGYENGNAFYGTKGFMIFGKESGWTLYGERNKLIAKGSGRPDLDAHHTDFLECIKTGRTPNADIEINHLSTTICHLGNIATRLRRVLTFDPKTETFVGDPEADALVKRSYRDHWATPRGV